MRRAQIGVGAIVAAAALGVSRPAAAFVRYITDDNAPFFWAEATVAITGYANDFTQSTMTPDEVGAAFAAAAAAWSKESDACTYLELHTSLSTAPTPLATNDGRNSLIFRNTVWCHVGASGACNLDYDSSALAVTTDNANTMTGQIYDSDLEVNLVDYQWADVVANPSLAADMDLQNALTHELGHLIGLDHTCFDPVTSKTGVRPDDNNGQPIPDCATASADVQATTMFPSADHGDIEKRTLAPDDQNAVCTIYSASNPLPPPNADVNGGCAECGAAGGPAGGGAVTALAALTALLLARRRRPAALRR